MKVYTKEEVDSLMMNPFIIFVRDDRAIEYDPAFKLWTIYMKRTHPEISCKKLFEMCGFNMKILNARLPYSRIHDWEDRYEKYSYKWFAAEYKWAEEMNGLISIIYPTRVQVNKLSIKEKIYREVEIYVENEKRCSSSY